MTFLFDPNKCPVGSIPSVDFVFISECSIAPPPPPIFDCPPPLVPREPPPPPCPEFSGRVTVTTGQEGCIGSTSATLTVTEEPNCKDPCRFLIDLDLRIPVPVPPCPDISGGSGKIVVAPEGCIEPKAKISVRATSEPIDCEGNGGCKFLIDLDLAIPVPVPPCPEISAGSSKLVVAPKGCIAPKARVNVRKEETEPSCDSEETNCKFFIDLDLAIPVPVPPCPVISAGDVNITMKKKDCGDASGAITVTQKPKQNSCGSEAEDEACEFKIDLALQIPVPEIPCPELSIKYDDTIDTPTVVQKPRETDCEDDPLAPPGCDFTISIPTPPCPEITGSIKVYEDPEIEEPSGSIKIDKPTGCEFDISIDIAIPEIEIPCPEITGSINVYEDPEINEPSGSINISPQSGVSGCSFDISIDIAIPEIEIPCPEITGSINVYEDPEIDEPSGSINISPQSGVSGCSFDISIDIAIPEIEIPCPEITGSINVYEDDEIDEPSGSINISPQSGVSGCSFDISIDIAIPEVEIPCPEITGSINVYEDDEIDEPSGSITITNPTGCDFDISIDIAIPEVEIPCPEITGSINVYEDPEIDEPSGSITIANPTGCDFDISIDIAIPAVEIPCPEITGSINVYEDDELDEPAGSITITNPTGCDFDISIDIAIPTVEAPCPEITGSINVYEDPEIDEPSGSITIANPTGCDFDISIDIAIPEVEIPCPEITGSVNVYEDDELDAPSGSINISPQSGVSGCSFDLQIEIGLPGSTGPKNYTGGDVVISPSGMGGGQVNVSESGVISVDIDLSVIDCPTGEDGASGALVTCDDVIACVADNISAGDGPSPPPPQPFTAAPEFDENGLPRMEINNVIYLMPLFINALFTSVTFQQTFVSWFSQLIISNEQLLAAIIDAISESEEFCSIIGRCSPPTVTAPATLTGCVDKPTLFSASVNYADAEATINVTVTTTAGIAGRVIGYAEDGTVLAAATFSGTATELAAINMAVGIPPDATDTIVVTITASVTVGDSTLTSSSATSITPEQCSSSSSSLAPLKFVNETDEEVEFYTFEYDEEVVADTVLGTVIATGGDGNITYSITSNDVIDIASPGSPTAAIVDVFKIDANTGAISLTNSVLNFNPNDYERSPNSRTITVRATSGSQTKDIEVTLNEVNLPDVKPKFLLENGNETDSYTFTYEEGRTNVDVLGRVYASDPDELSTPQFEIVTAGSPHVDCLTGSELSIEQRLENGTLFFINATTGEIKLSATGLNSPANEGSTSQITSRTITVAAFDGDLVNCVDVDMRVTGVP